MYLGYGSTAVTVWKFISIPSNMCFIMFSSFYVKNISVCNVLFRKFGMSSWDCYKCSIHLVFHLRRQKSEKCDYLSSWRKNQTLLNFFISYAEISYRQKPLVLKFHFWSSQKKTLIRKICCFKFWYFVGQPLWTW